MKALMIAPQPFFEPRGTPISVYQRLQALSTLGHEVDVVTYHLGKDVDFPGVKIHRIPNIPFIKSVKIGPSLVKLLLDVVMFFKAFFMLLFNRYDVIHSHEEGSFMVIILATLFRTRHIYDMHSRLPKQLENFKVANCWPLIQIFEFLEKMVIHTSDSIITIGSDLEEYVYQLNPDVKHVRLENMPVRIPNQLDPADLKNELGVQDKLVMVYTGTFESYQGLDLLLESAAIVVRERQDATFVLVGGTPEQVKYWKNEAKRLALGENTIFVGTVSLEDSIHYLNMADILVSPRTGGLSVPLKIYSYLFSGKPIVATDIFAHTQVLNKNISMIAGTESSSYAKQILKLAQNPELRCTIGSQAKAFAKERFSAEDYLSKLDWIYQINNGEKSTVCNKSVGVDSNLTFVGEK